MATSEDKKKALVEYVDQQFAEYTNSTAYSNWKLLCDNVMDAAEQRYRPGEQLTRQGMYWAVMRAQRDGWREGAVETFGMAKPLFLYKPRRGVQQDLANRAQEVMANLWDDIDGLTKWLLLFYDSVDYSMAVAYTKYCHYYEEVEAPVEKKEVWGKMLDWEPEFSLVADSPDFIRIHPYNYRCSLRTGQGILGWEGCEWEWDASDLHSMLGNEAYNQAAIKRLIEKLGKGEIGKKSRDFYDKNQAYTGEQGSGNRLYAKEFWGKASGARGYERDAHEYAILTCEGEVLRCDINYLRIGRQPWRPFKRVRLDPMQDLPYGCHVLAPTLSHQRMKNLMNNLVADDLVIRQHLGLAVWRGALENPNQLLNPEGAREPIFMRHDAPIEKIPRFFADQGSGVVRDAIQFDREVVERDLQIGGLPYQSLGLGGGAQGGTATEQRYLANNANRKSRRSIIWSVETGLKPIGKDLLLLLLRNNAPTDLRLSNEEFKQIFFNNFWEASDVITTDMVSQNMALANWGQVALQKLAEITTKDRGADHVVSYLKDLGRTMGIPASRLDEYLPTPAPPDLSQPKAQPGPQGRPAQVPPGMIDAMPAQSPLAVEDMPPSAEEAANVMG